MINPLLKDEDVIYLSKMQHLVEYAPILNKQLGGEAGWEHIWEPFWKLRNSLSSLFDVQYYSNTSYEEDITTCWYALKERVDRLGIKLYEEDEIPTTTKNEIPNIGIIVAVEQSIDDYTFLVLSDGSKIRGKYMEFLSK